MKRAFLFFLFLFAAASLFGQEKDTEKPATDPDSLSIIGEQLNGYEVDGAPVREFIGNVILTHGDITITCDRAIHYISQNDARLIGNVICTQKTVRILTPEGFYSGEERTASSKSNVTLEDGEIVLKAKTGKYAFEEQIATFTGNVQLRDTASFLSSQSLIYYRKDARAVASGDVFITDSSNVIHADSLIFFRRTKNSEAFGNLKLINKADNLTLYGQHLIDERTKNYSVIDSLPLMVQVDTTGGKSDSLLVISQVMESFRGKKGSFIATDSVYILSGAFASRNDRSFFSRLDGKLTTSKIGEKGNIPVLWMETSQLSGDSIAITLERDTLKLLEVYKNALLITKTDSLPMRCDQISSNNIFLHFDKGNVSYAETIGNLLSIYYMYEDGKPAGLVKSSARSGKIFFVNRFVREVRLYGEPNTEFHPEVLVKGNEKVYFLPNYIDYGKKPERSQFLKRVTR